jgi:ectoine hydroxylase-related dioxygenase (phytanoyl-CoA dioxygenase family)
VTELTESSPFDDADILRKRFEEEGYLFLRGLIPPDDVLRVRADFVTALQSVGWVQEVSDQAIPTSKARRESPDSGPEFFEGYIALQRLQSFHELGHHPRIREALGVLIPGDLLAHPRKVARAALPKDFNFMTASHQDYRLIQGTADVLTLWVPLGDCPQELGGLAMLSGSYRRGLLPAVEAPGVGGLRVDIPADFDSPDLDWRTSDMQAGDALLFHSLTVHAAKPNYTDSLRLSVDYRYQSLDDPVLPASLGPHGRPHVPEYAELTADWTETWSVDTPEGVRLAEQFDVFDPSIPTPPSRILPLP